MLRRLLIASTIVAVAVPAFAQETMRVRGTIEKVDGSTLIVKSRDGADLKIAVVGDKPVYTALEKASLADIKPGTYIGVTSLAFLSVDGIYRAVGYEGRDPHRPQFTDHCFTGDYPTPLTDLTGERGKQQLSLLAEAG